MKLVVYKQKTTIDKNSLKYKIFRDILKKGSVKGNHILIYVFLLCDLSINNPILEIQFDQKEGEAKLIAFGKEDFNIEMNTGQNGLN